MVEEDVDASAAQRVRRAEMARVHSRKLEVQAIAIMWLGVLLAVGGIVVLIVTGGKLIAGVMTFGGAGVLLLGLLRGAYGHYVYWRVATG